MEDNNLETKEASHLWLVVSISGGAHISVAAKQLATISTCVGWNIRTSFSGIPLLVTPGMTPHEIAKQFDDGLRIEAERLANGK